MNSLMRAIVICGLIAGLVIPGFAAEEKSSAREQTSVSKQEKVEVKSEAKVEKAVVKEEAKPAAKVEKQEKSEAKPAVAAAEAPKAEPPKEEMAHKSMTGEVAGISPIFIAVMYDQDDKSAYEMALNLDPKVKIVGKKDTSEIHAGDTVTVSYDERFQKDEKGDIRINGRKVTSIAFVLEGKKLIEEELPVAPPAEEGSQK